MKYETPEGLTLKKMAKPWTLVTSPTNCSSDPAKSNDPTPETVTVKKSPEIPEWLIKK